VHSELEQLLVLQDRQQKIRQIQTEIKTLPLERAHLESQLDATAAGVESLKQKGRQVEVERKRLELDVGTRTESISRLKTQQYQTRKNDEFQAISHEIERYENEIRKLEDQELELMIEADKLKAEIEAADKSARATKDSISRQLTTSKPNQKRWNLSDRNSKPSGKRLRLKSTPICSTSSSGCSTVKATLRSSPWSMVFAPAAT
jgi:uncharacterized protein